MNADLICRILSNLNTINATSVKDVASDANRFEQQYCYTPALQPFFAAEGMTMVLSSIKPNTFYVMEDTLHVFLILFSFQEQKFIIGPYVRGAYQENRMSPGLLKLQLSQVQLLAVKNYYTQFPIHETPVLLQRCYSVISAFQKDLPEYAVRSLHGFHDKVTPDALEDNWPDQIAQIYQNYERENKLLKMVEAGRVSDALRALQDLRGKATLEAMSSNIGAYRSGSTVQTIMRTLVRKAAEMSGLPIVTIHQLTQEEVQRSCTCTNSDEMHRSMYILVRDLTTEVHRHKLMLKGYSKDTQQVLEYLSLHYTEPIRLEDVLSAVNLSKTHLSSLFKKDTGRTMMQYVTKMRCDKASQLLVETNLPIQDVSMLVGYEDSNYFVKVFRKELNDTPTGYRESHRLK